MKETHEQRKQRLFELYAPHYFTSPDQDIAHCLNLAQYVAAKVIARMPNEGADMPDERERLLDDLAELCMVAAREFEAHKDEFSSTAIEQWKMKWADAAVTFRVLTREVK